jgi:hypothetical protein
MICLISRYFDNFNSLLGSKKLEMQLEDDCVGVMTLIAIRNNRGCIFWRSVSARFNDGLQRSYGCIIQDTSLMWRFLVSYRSMLFGKESAWRYSSILCNYQCAYLVPHPPPPQGSTKMAKLGGKLSATFWYIVISFWIGAGNCRIFSRHHVKHHRALYTNKWMSLMSTKYLSKHHKPILTYLWPVEYMQPRIDRMPAIT